MPRRKPTRVYLDAAAALPLTPRALRATTAALQYWGNPSAAHAEGRAAHEALDAARTQIAASLGTQGAELVFTSGGTESNTLAILGLVHAARRAGAAYVDLHIISSSIEHSSTRATLERLALDGVRVTYIQPEPDGVVSAAKVIAALRPETLLITLAHVNSESGTVQPIADIGSALRKEKSAVVLHADAAQSPSWLDAGPHTLRADLVSYDAQKVGGPKGVGVLYRNYRVPLVAVVGGGTQERGIRPGTENVPALVGAAAAFTDAAKGRKARAIKVAKLRDTLLGLVTKAFPDVVVIGGMKRRVANNLFIALPGADADYLTVLLDKEGVSVTPRSACLGTGGGLSEVALTITGDEALARSTVRFSLSPNSSLSDIKTAVAALQRVVPLARSRK